MQHSPSILRRISVVPRTIGRSWNFESMFDPFEYIMIAQGFIQRLTACSRSKINYTIIFDCETSLENIDQVLKFHHEENHYGHLTPCSLSHHWLFQKRRRHASIAEFLWSEYSLPETYWICMQSSINITKHPLIRTLPVLVHDNWNHTVISKYPHLSSSPSNVNRIVLEFNLLAPGDGTKPLHEPLLTYRQLNDIIWHSRDGYFTDIPIFKIYYYHN